MSRNLRAVFEPLRDPYFKNTSLAIWKRLTSPLQHLPLSLDLKFQPKISQRNRATKTPFHPRLPRSVQKTEQRENHSSHGKNHEDLDEQRIHPWIDDRQWSPSDYRLRTQKIQFRQSNQRNTPTSKTNGRVELQGLFNF